MKSIDDNFGAISSPFSARPAIVGRLEGIHALLFAAGLGSRLKPWTDQHPKALAMVKTREIQDAKTVLLLQYAQLEGLM